MGKCNSTISTNKVTMVRYNNLQIQTLDYLDYMSIIKIYISNDSLSKMLINDDLFEKLIVDKFTSEEDENTRNLLLKIKREVIKNSYNMLFSLLLSLLKLTKGLNKISKNAYFLVIKDFFSLVFPETIQENRNGDIYINFYAVYQFICFHTNFQFLLLNKCNDYKKQDEILDLLLINFLVALDYKLNKKEEDILSKIKNQVRFSNENVVSEQEVKTENYFSTNSNTKSAFSTSLKSRKSNKKVTFQDFNVINNKEECSFWISLSFSIEYFLNNIRYESLSASSFK